MRSGVLHEGNMISLPHDTRGRVLLKSLLIKTNMAATASLRKFRIALIQLAIGAKKTENIRRAVSRIADAAKNGAKLVSLPECCTCPYGNTYFPEYAESIPGPATEAFACAARDHKVFLIAGSIPERDGDKLFNTSVVFGPEGDVIAKHRKMHLFDIDIPGKITFQESKTLTPGDSFTTFDTPFCKVGVGICYDMRFAEMAQVYRTRDCKLIVYPGAFNMTTGQAHWELIQRGRAVDNQVYVATVSPARDESASYVAWGHSTMVSPWGDVVAKAGSAEEVVYADIDLDYVDEIRGQIPLTNQRRHDTYLVKDLTNED